MTCIEVMLFTRRRHFHHTFHVIFALHISFQNDMDHILNLLLFVLIQINKRATIQSPRVSLSQILFLTRFCGALEISNFITCFIELFLK